MLPLLSAFTLCSDMRQSHTKAIKQHVRAAYLLPYTCTATYYAISPVYFVAMPLLLQVDLSASSIRPGQPAAWFEALRGRLLAAVSDSKAEVVVCVGTWAHDLDQARALPQERIKMQVWQGG